jgi:hypothetical protein
MTVWLALVGIAAMLSGYFFAARRFVRWFPSWLTDSYARRHGIERGNTK